VIPTVAIRGVSVFLRVGGDSMYCTGLLCTTDRCAGIVPVERV
jgi:hypothetical protein